MDCHLNWKDHVLQISRKISRGTGALSKLRHYIDCNVLKQIYYAIIYPFLTFGFIVWGNTYITTIKPLQIIQKKAIRIITFSKYDAHTNQLFVQLQLLKFSDIITYYTSLFMHKYNNGHLPECFDTYKYV